MEKSQTLTRVIFAWQSRAHTIIERDFAWFFFSNQVMGKDVPTAAKSRPVPYANG